MLLTWPRLVSMCNGNGLDVRAPLDPSCHILYFCGRESMLLGGTPVGLNQINTCEAIQRLAQHYKCEPGLDRWFSFSCLPAHPGTCPRLRLGQGALQGPLRVPLVGVRMRVNKTRRLASETKALPEPCHLLMSPTSLSPSHPFSACQSLNPPHPRKSQV